MKIIFVSLFLLGTSSAFSQFAIVNDKDGFVNVRVENSINSKVQDKLDNGQLIYCYEDVDNWTNIEYDKGSEEFTGYIYKDRFKKISDFPAFKIVNETPNLLTLKQEDTEVIITKRKFDASKHKFTYNKENSTELEYIDGQMIWGTDGGMPTTQYESIILKIGSKTIVLPPRALETLYEPSWHDLHVNYDKDTETIYIHSGNSDGAGSYGVVWRIVKGKYKDRMMAFGY